MERDYTQILRFVLTCCAVDSLLSISMTIVLVTLESREEDFSAVSEVNISIPLDSMLIYRL